MKDLMSVDIDTIAQKILAIRGQKMMLDSDLAKLYGVETRVLIQAVKRNMERFPKNFMFQFRQHSARASPLAAQVWPLHKPVFPFHNGG